MRIEAADSAPTTGVAVFERAGSLRAALGQPHLLRREAERLLAAVPRGCDLLAWSPDAYTVAVVASALGAGTGRGVVAHRASHLAPHPPPLRTGPWTWVSAEELLGLGAPRAWVREWASAHGGVPHREPLALAS